MNDGASLPSSVRRGLPAAGVGLSGFRVEDAVTHRDQSPDAVQRRLWVVSELYYPEQTSTGYFITRIAESLADRYEVRALCSQPTYSARGVRAPQRETRQGVEVHRCRSTRLDKDVLPLRAVNIATFTFAVFWRLLREARPGDFVLVVTNPPLLPYAVTAAARVRGARVVLLIHDLFPEVFVATGFARPESALVRVIDRASRWLYGRVDRIVVLGRDMRAIVASKSRRSDHEIATLPNWGDTELIRPEAETRKAARVRLGIEQRFVVQFMGNMGRSHAMEALVDAAHTLREERRVHFQFIGWGARRAWLESAVRDAGLNNVSLLPNCSEDELPALLNACDIGIIAFRPGMAGVSVPSRMYNIMAAGKPILAVADPHSELARVVIEEEIGWVVPADSPARLPAVILDAMRDPDIRGKGERARRAAEQRYSLAEVAKGYRTLFESLEHETA